MWSPSPILASLNARMSGRSPEGTAMLAASSRKHIAHRAGLGRPGARPELTATHRCCGECEMDT
jgi:hypothetical protein